MRFFFLCVPVKTFTQILEAFSSRIVVLLLQTGSDTDTDLNDMTGGDNRKPGGDENDDDWSPNQE